jgi:type II secretory pathway component PulF
MKNPAKILLIIVVVILSFALIGSAFFLIPKFEEIYEDIYAPNPLPHLTAIIIEAPRIVWLAIPAALAAVNVLIITRFKSVALSMLSAGIMFLTPAVVVVGLFLPMNTIIKELNGGAPESEP